MSGWDDIDPSGRVSGDDEPANRGYYGTDPATGDPGPPEPEPDRVDGPLVSARPAGAVSCRRAADGRRGERCVGWIDVTGHCTACLMAPRRSL